MTTQTPPQKQYWIKAGIGIELTVEAMLDLVRQRFPDIVDWNNFQTPAMDFDNQTQRIGFYQTHVATTTDPDVSFEDVLPPFNDDVIRPFRRVGQGAPIPVMGIRREMVTLSTGEARCAGLVEGAHDSSPPYRDSQCGLSLSHEGQHELVATEAGGY